MPLTYQSIGDGLAKSVADVMDFMQEAEARRGHQLLVCPQLCDHPYCVLHRALDCYREYAKRLAGTPPS
jgi:hypothetical protein